jgi:poly(A) RNA polymerase GLD2
MFCFCFFFCGIFKLSQQILELFETCQQQASDLKKKELCRAQLQREIQLLFPRMSAFSAFALCVTCLHLHNFLWWLSSASLESRLFLVGSSLNGFGARSSDGDLCLVVKEEPVSDET